MSAITFEDAPIPDSADPEETSDDLSCSVCGVPLVYSGRGRKPTKCDEHKRSSGTNTGRTTIRTSADVNSALATLDGLYGGLAMGLMMVSPAAAQTWVNNAAELQKQNRIILTGDRELTRSINNMASKGGRAAFAVAHVIAIAPVVVIAQQEIAARGAERQRQADAAAAQAQASTPFDLG